MNALFVTLRAIHYGSAMLLFGELVFMLVVANPALRLARADGRGADFFRRTFVFACFCVVASLLSGVGWFVAELTVMSGLPLDLAMTRETLGLALGNTLFGRVCVVRLGLLAALAAALVAMRWANDDARRSRFAIVAVAFATLYLGSLAWVGHAIAGDESADLVRIVADVSHLLAAGAWLGALPALVLALRRAPTPLSAMYLAQRFSVLGATSVGVLTASGFVNAWYQVGGMPALAGTDYGRLLVAKVMLFIAMLGLATVNRGISRRPLFGDDHAALRWLRRNAMLEIAFGIGVIAIVGVLGVTVPAIHQPPVWPFDRALGFDTLQQSAWMQLGVAAACAVMGMAAIALVAGLLSRPPRLGLAAVAGIVIPGVIVIFLLAVPAYPTTYLASPVRYTADAIATGSTLYAANCAACHGRDGRGDDPDAFTPPDPRRNLNDHVPNRREGDLYWSIAHGMPGTPMPQFASQLNDMEIWSLIQYLDAQAAARNALAMSDRLKPLLPIPAPDFTYELIGRPQESLRQSRGNGVTLLVLYTLPSSLQRLRELATRERAYTAAGARVIAVPMPGTSTATPGDAGGGESMLAHAGPAVATAYTMFARESLDANGNALAHVEYLIDRFDFLRARWMGVPDAAVGSIADALGQIDVLVHEPQRAQVQWGHRH